MMNIISSGRKITFGGVKKPQRCFYRRSGFTLVELLVCLAIIGILFSLTATALNQSRGQAKLIVCKNNLRSIVLGCLMYADENQGMLPVDNMLGPGYGSIANPHTNLIEALDEYIADPSCWYCPAETDLAMVYSKENYDAGVIGFFYYSCTQATGNGDISTFLRWDVSWPRYLRTDMPQDTWVVSDAWLRGRPTAHLGFKKAVNYAVLDGSVNMVLDSPRRQFK